MWQTLLLSAQMDEGEKGVKGHGGEMWLDPVWERSRRREVCCCSSCCLRIHFNRISSAPARPGENFNAPLCSRLSIKEEEALQTSTNSSFCRLVTADTASAGQMLVPATPKLFLQLV